MRTYYSYERRPLGGANFLNSIVGRIILTNVAVYILSYILPAQFIGLFLLTPKLVIEEFYFWQIFTYMFFHADFWHLFFNMLMLWLFGNTLESIWGGKRFLNYYIVCGIGGAVLSFVFNYNHHILGASGAIFGLYLAYAMIFPDNYIYLQFLFPVKAKHLIIFLAVMHVALGISGSGGIAFFAHLGGMGAGLLFFRKEISNWRIFSKWRRYWKGYSRQKSEARKGQEAMEINSILDKICSKGYENLSPTEKRILENYSRKQNKESDNQ